MDTDDQIESMMSKSQTIISCGPKKRNKATVCNVCGKEGRRSEILWHIETKHLDKSFPCNYCEITLRTKHGLGKHNRKQHKVFWIRSREDRAHVCDTCGKLFKQAGTLSSHMLVHNEEKNVEAEP